MMNKAEEKAESLAASHVRRAVQRIGEQATELWPNADITGGVHHVEVRAPGIGRDRLRNPLMRFLSWGFR